jgi:hypothetical protein
LSCARHEIEEEKKWMEGRKKLPMIFVASSPLYLIYRLKSFIGWACLIFKKNYILFNINIFWLLLAIL